MCVCVGGGGGGGQVTDMWVHNKTVLFKNFRGTVLFAPEDAF